MRFVIYKSTKPMTVQPYWFTIWSGSNRLAHSEMYASKYAAQQAILSIMKNAGSAEYEDRTGEKG